MKAILYKTAKEALDAIRLYQDASICCAKTIKSEDADNRTGESISGVYHGINFWTADDMFAMEGVHTIGWADNQDGKYVSMSLEDVIAFAKEIACGIEYGGGCKVILKHWVDGKDGEVIIDNTQYLQVPEMCRVPRRNIDYTNLTGDQYKIWRDLYRMRVSQGLTLQDIADKTGLQKSHLSEIENGKRNISVNILYKILMALNVDIKIV